MAMQTIECWNCGQMLQINADKLATARCGSCQQMVARQEQPQIKTEYQTTARTPQTKKRRPWISSFLMYLIGGVVGGGIGIFLFVFALQKLGLFGFILFLVIGVPILKFVFVDIIGGAVKAANEDRE